jgi:predicted secreted protein
MQKRLTALESSVVVSSDMSSDKPRKADPYRTELSTLQQVLEAVSALRERSAGLEQRASELRNESAALLDSDGALEQETSLATTAHGAGSQTIPGN